MNNSCKITAVVYGFSILYGLIYTAFLYYMVEKSVLAVSVIDGLALTLLMPFVFDLYRRLSGLFILKPWLDDVSARKFYRYEWLNYVFLPMTTVLFFTGIRPNLAFTITVCLFFIFIQVGLLFFSLDTSKRKELLCSERYIAVLFLISGFSALIYQVVWQRILFTTFGVNSESVTVIVSVFMFGLGIGSLLGGYLQKRFANHLLSLFLALEISIGLFGLFSLPLIHAVGDLAATESLSILLLRIYGILVIPTLLMGATLPILVSYLQNYFHNIGKTVGLLYAFNTLGSAIAAFLTVEVLFVYFGQQMTVEIAVFCNLITAYLIFKVSRQLTTQSTTINTNLEIPVANQKRLPYGFVFITLLSIGYISLSQEILWFRLLGFMTANRPQVFGLLLTTFLIGIAWGSLNAKKSCESGRDYYRYLVVAIFCAALLFYIAFPIISTITAYFGQGGGMLAAYFFIGIVAYFTGGILPLLMHAGIDSKSANPATTMSWLYFANIIGATSGPLLTGFVLLDYFSLEMNVVILSGVTLVLLFALLLFIPESKRFKSSVIAAVITLTLTVTLFHSSLYQTYLEKIQYASTNHEPFKYTLENRSGILTVEKQNADIMFGNGIYDGRFNTSLSNNSNMIDRAYMVAALHPKPKQILEIGLSTGSWARILADYEPLEKMTIIEINKGYPKIIEHYPDIASVLTHPKVELFFDDGRRWLNHHPEQKFDFIVMNTTYYWRSNSTNLLSVEFLQLCKQHLNEGGVIYYNTTGSKNVSYTAANVFDYVTIYSNFVAASDAPFNMTVQERKQNLLNFKPENKSDNHESLIERLAQHKLPDLRQESLNTKGLWRITDDNMATEYKVTN